MSQTLVNQVERSRVIEPIRDPIDVQRIRKTLEPKPRDLLFFDLATQTGLRVKELLNLRVSDLLGLSPGDSLNLAETAGDGANRALFTKEIHRTFRHYIENANLQPEDYLFKSRKGGRSLTISSVSHMVRAWFESANIEGVYGAKSLHKTWEYFTERLSNNRAESSHGDSFMGHIEPVDTTTLQQRVYDALFQAIVSAKIPPGTRLTSSKIAREFKVGQMPIRGALSRLEAIGFVATQKKRGTIVRDLSKDDLREIFTIRLALETLAARLACKLRSEETLRCLESLMKDYVATTEVEELLRINREFHHTLYRDAHMPMLQQFIVGLWDRVSPYLHLYMLSTKDLDVERKPSIKCHQGMLDGMRRKDSKEVVKWLNSDLKRCFSRELKALKRL